MAAVVVAGYTRSCLVPLDTELWWSRWPTRALRPANLMLDARCPCSDSIKISEAGPQTLTDSSPSRRLRMLYPIE